MNIEKVIKLIKTDERFSNIFHFYSNERSDFNDMLPTKELKKQFSFVKWLYLTTVDQVTFIGLDGNYGVFVMDSEGDTFVLCDSFFDIPFEIIKDHIRDKNYKILLHDKYEFKNYLENLKFYANWCKEHNIKINDRYLEILKQ